MSAIFVDIVDDVTDPWKDRQDRLNDRDLDDLHRRSNVSSDVIEIDPGGKIEEIFVEGDVLSIVVQDLREKIAIDGSGIVSVVGNEDDLRREDREDFCRRRLPWYRRQRVRDPHGIVRILVTGSGILSGIGNVTGPDRDREDPRRRSHRRAILRSAPDP